MQATDGRLFVTRVGRAGVPLPPPFNKPLRMGTAYRIWDIARAAAFTDVEYASPLARRPYDLRHAAPSTWLNAGVPPTQVAEWAGHIVMVLLRVYAKCIYGQEEMATQRIDAALALPPTKTEAKASAVMAEEVATTTTGTAATPGDHAAARTSPRIPANTRRRPVLAGHRRKPRRAPD
jgi:hypothetical protein